VYRFNAIGDTIEKAFIESGIPYQRARRSDPKCESEELDPRAEAVTLMTIHAAKGLEFPVVFVTACEDEIIPGDQDNDSVDNKEELRLLYVAMTRAGRELFLTRARRRVIFGRSQKSPRTRFLDLSVNSPVFELSTPLEGRNRRKESIPIQHDLFQ
jgi:superfamily I DNA/RNA helicase